MSRYDCCSRRRQLSIAEYCTHQLHTAPSKAHCRQASYEMVLLLLPRAKQLGHYSRASSGVLSGSGLWEAPLRSVKVLFDLRFPEVLYRSRGLSEAMWMRQCSKYRCRHTMYEPYRPAARCHRATPFTGRWPERTARWCVWRAAFWRSATSTIVSEPGRCEQSMAASMAHYRHCCCQGGNCSPGKGLHCGQLSTTKATCTLAKQIAERWKRLQRSSGRSKRRLCKDLARRYRFQRAIR